MSKILDLAKTFKETSSKEAESISKALQHDLKQLEGDLATALSKSNETLKNAIHDSNEVLKKEIYANQQRMSMSLFKTWLWVIALLVLLGLGLTTWSMWQGLTIQRQSQAIAQGKQVLAELPEGLELVKEKGETYLVQDVKMKKKPEVWQSQDGHWIIKVGK
ncbi:MbeB family mobilization protein [uncultured Acinetobacter sp.]|uniref:MbeB family mobilization protein n=1 Tax=uncultured Acinetobacter sp. TaxID=165433 RepID=UPI00345DF752